ncbi:hypothetical protein ACJIZ3_009210 [Penstemon smallii]|uniref:SKP1-like protein n=1 Tax=Penstemon smallii TaxID=265156 RepID=A0ABD3TBV2_9LAMI
MAEENTITLKSSDGQEFLISKKAAILSEKIKAMVEEHDSSSVFPLTDVNSKTLADVITFLNKHVECGDDDDKKKSCNDEFIAGKEFNDLFNLADAAIYLDVKSLLDLITGKMADMIKDKSVKWMRKNFNLQNDFSPEEEEKIRKEYAWAHEGVEED